MEDVVVGIDLGTTNCCVAAIVDGRPKIIEDERGYNILPSCVAFRSKGKFVVGHGAKALILTNPDQTVYAIKRLIGRKFTSPEVQSSRKRLSYQIFEGVNDEVLLRLGEVELTPVEVSSVIIKCIREVAERSGGRSVQRAVVTVPAYFNNAQRAATKEAVELAGLECIRLINEPTAAALAYGFKRDLEKKIAVFDLGGGTFDISVLEISSGVYETLGTSGNSYLGGEDFDYRIVDHLAEQFLSDHGVDLRDEKMSLQRLKDAAERAKCELSFVDKTPLLIPRVHGEFNLETTLTRTTLEGLVDDLIRETIRITSEALSEANISIEELDEIILVGGMTRMPKVQEAIRVFFGMSPCKGVHPEEVVAVGAAVQAFSLEEEGDGHLLLDVTPFSLGIDTAGGYFGKVIGRNSTVPINQARTFTTVTDNQEEVRIMVRQGESNLATENEFLGEFILQGIRPAPRMVPRVDVSFKIDSNGILSVAAVDRDTGEKKAVRIKDYIDKASSYETSTDIQLAENEGIGSAVAAGAAGAAGGGLFGKLKGMFGGNQPQPSATDIADRDGAATGQSSTELADKDASATLSASTDLADRDSADVAIASPVPASTELEDRQTVNDAARPASLGTDLDEPSLAPVPFGKQAEPIPMPAPETPILGEDSGIAAELKASLGALFDTGGEAGSESGEGDSSDALPTDAYNGDDNLTGAPAALGADQAMVPVDDDAMSGSPSFAATQSADGSDPGDPFAVQERPELDPFATGGGSGADSGADDAADPFAASGTEHSHRVRKVDTQVQTKPDITPATIGLAGTPETAAAAKKKPAKLKIRYKRPQTFVKEFAENLERGGTYIKTPKPLENGRRCVFELTVPGFAQPLQIRGAVTWSSRGETTLTEGRAPGMVIDYDTEDTEGLDSVRRAVATLSG